MMTKPRVWLYWDEPPGGIPGYIEICLELIVKWAQPFEVVVLNSTNAFEYIEGLNPDFPKIAQIAHRADYVRAACLAQNGGIWLDIDTIPLAPLSVIYSLTPFSGAVFYGWKFQEPSIGMIAAQPGHELLVRWREGIEEKLQQNLEQRWSGIGYDILWPLAKKIGYAHLDRETCAPLHYTQTGVFAADRSVESVRFSNTMMIQLYNRGLSREMGSMSPAELKSGNTLMRRAIDLSTALPADNGAIWSRLQDSVCVSAAAAGLQVDRQTTVNVTPLFNQALRIGAPGLS